MSAKWIARLAIQLACAFVALYVAGELLPDRTKPENFKVAGIVLSASAAALAFADIFFSGAVKKLDEPVVMPSFSIEQRKQIRAELLRLESSLTVSFYISVVTKGLFGCFGLLFVAQVVPDVHLCTWMFFIGFFLLGFTLPNVILMPRAYFAAKISRLELIELEEKAAAKARLLESLEKDQEHDFANDPHFAAFSRVVNLGE